jgi:Putative stress-responsive transcriptional regulator
VCSGLARYFNINVIIPRVIFIVPFLSFVFHSWHWGWWGFPHFLSLSFSPGAFFTYIILWLVIPEAKTTADKLEMKGEKVDLNNIKSTIQGDLEGFGKRAKEWGKEMGEKGKEFGEEMKKTFSEKGKEFTETAKQAGKQFSSETTPVIKKTSHGLGDLIAVIFKVFAYFIIGVVLFAVVVALFSLGVVLTGLTPVEPYILNKGWQEIFAWGTLLFFVWVPVVGIITWVIRRLAGSKSNNKLLRYSFIALWTIGWACLICLIASVSKDFKYENSPVEETISLANPTVNKLEFVATKSSYKYRAHRWFKIEPFVNFVDDDSLYVNNVHFRIVKSNTDSFKVTILKIANGSSRKNAENLASLIEYNPVQTDSIVTMPLGIRINTQDKFRNQHVIITIAVPVGKKIKINQEIWDKGASGRINFWNDNNWDDEWGDEERGWRTNVEYIQTQNGLKRADDNSSSWDNDDNNNDDNNGAIEDFKKSKEELKKQREQKMKELEELDKELQPASGDSTRYHYQPGTPKAPARPKKDISKQASISNMVQPVFTNDLLFLKFLI